MKTDYNSILEIKNGNIRKEEFFKNKLKESIKKLNLKDKVFTLSPINIDLNISLNLKSK